MLAAILDQSVPPQEPGPVGACSGVLESGDQLQLKISILVGPLVPASSPASEPEAFASKEAVSPPRFPSLVPAQRALS